MSDDSVDNDPFGFKMYVETVLDPASATTRTPRGPKVKAKGTGVGGRVDHGRGQATRRNRPVKTSMSLPLFLVVTISCRPSGENPMSPGPIR